MPFDPAADANPRYSPAGMPTLSDAAQELDPPALNDFALLAESLLGLRTVDLMGTAMRTAKLAVGLQVSFMVENGVAARLYTQVTEGQRTFKFTDAATSIGIDPVAAQLVAPFVSPPVPVLGPVPPIILSHL